MKFKHRLGLCIIFSLAISSIGFAQEKYKQPNILFILSDDAGYHDFGFHGSKTMKTPNLDKLANQGIIFTQAYVSAAVCGPSRAGILTGQYQQKFGYEENNVPGYMSKSSATGDEMGLPLDLKILPQYLKDLGYQTALIGKWHQGHADKFHPTKRGFDYFVGFRGGARSYFEFNNDNPNPRQEDYLEQGFNHFSESKQYLTKEFADRTIDFIESNQSTPFFAFLSFNAVHTPVEALPADLAQFPNLTGKRKTLAAMNLAMDREIGRILDKLEQLKIADNTLVIYTNDNGGPSDTNASNNAPFAGTKASHYEGGIRVPFIVRWPKLKSNLSSYNKPISTLDLMPTFINAAGGKASAIKGLDGVDLKPYLEGKITASPHHTLYWKKENRGAIRQGDWKLLRFPDRPAELYQISQDESEQHNLARQYPDKVRALFKALFNWELTLERPKWQLQRKYEGKAMERIDTYRKPAISD